MGIASTTGSGAAANHHFITLPTAAIGDRMLLLMSVDVGPEINVSAAFTQIENALAASYSFRWAIYQRVVDGTEPEAINIQIPPAQSEEIAWITLVIDGVNLASGVATSTTSFATTANPDPNSVTAPWGAHANNLFIAITAWDGSVTMTSPPSGYTTWSNSIVVTGACGIGFGAKQANAASDDPGTFTLSGSEETASRTLAIRMN